MNQKTEYGIFEDLTQQISSPMADICQALRQQILAAAPDVQEIIWVKQKIASYGVGPKKMTEHYVYIAPYKNHVNLGFYWGAELGNNQNFEGSGKNLRHIKVKNATEANNPEFTKLIKAAINERKQALKL